MIVNTFQKIIKCTELEPWKCFNVQCKTNNDTEYMESDAGFYYVESDAGFYYGESDAGFY